LPHRLLTYSICNGLSLIKLSKQKAYVIHMVPFVPCALTCFDCTRDAVGIGTEDGQFWLIEIGTSEVRLKIQLSKSPITRLRFQSDILFHFITDSDSGSFNIRTRELKRFRAAIDLFASDDLGILVHSTAALGLIQDGRERPVVLRQPMIAVVPQRARTPATCFGGDNPNFAICSDRTVFIYSSRSLKSVVSFRPTGFEALCAIAWNGNSLAVADETGQIVIHDFMFQTEQRFGAVPNIAKIEWNANDLFFLTKDGILAQYRAKTCVARWSGVKDFAVTTSGFVFTKLAGKRMKRLIPKGSQSGPAIAPLIQRIGAVSAQILTTARKSPRVIRKLYEDAGFIFEGCLWRVIDRFFNGKALPLRMALHGGRSEVVERMRYRLRFLSAAESIEAVIALQVRLHEITAVADTLSHLNSNDSRFLLATIAGALLADGKMSDRTIELLKMAAVSLFASQKVEGGTLLLQLCGLDLTAVQYLQDTDHWTDALEILKTQELTDSIRALLRKCAHFFLENGQENLALLLFASFGDFHPVLAILLMVQRPCAAFHVMMHLDSRGPIHEYSEDPAKYHVQFSSLEYLRERIVEQSEQFLVVQSGPSDRAPPPAALGRAIRR
jgi:hypothetical protein